MNLRNYSINQIASGSFIILFDTSAILNPIDHDRGKLPIEDKIRKYKEKASFFYLLSRLVEKQFPAYITEGILDELLDGVNYRDPNYFGQTSLKVRELHRNHAGCICKRKELTDAFIDNSRVLKLNEDEQTIYSCLRVRYCGMKEEYKLSENDWDFLISGLALSQKRASLALISNDIYILNALKKFLKLTQKLQTLKM